VEPLEFPQVAQVPKLWYPAEFLEELQEELQKLLFFESPPCRKVSKINYVAINGNLFFKNLANLLNCK
jgi:hypothetical protein